MDLEKVEATLETAIMADAGLAARFESWTRSVGNAYQSSLKPSSKFTAFARTLSDRDQLDVYTRALREKMMREITQKFKAGENPRDIEKTFSNQPYYAEYRQFFPDVIKSISKLCKSM